MPIRRPATAPSTTLRAGCGWKAALGSRAGSPTAKSPLATARSDCASESWLAQVADRRRRVARGLRLETVDLRVDRVDAGVDRAALQPQAELLEDRSPPSGRASARRSPSLRSPRSGSGSSRWAAPRSRSSAARPATRRAWRRQVRGRAPPARVRLPSAGRGSPCRSRRRSCRRPADRSASRPSGSARASRATRRTRRRPRRRRGRGSAPTTRAASTGGARSRVALPSRQASATAGAPLSGCCSSSARSWPSRARPRRRSRHARRCRDAAHRLGLAATSRGTADRAWRQPPGAAHFSAEVTFLETLATERTWV